MTTRTILPLLGTLSLVLVAGCAAGGLPSARASADDSPVDVPARPRVAAAVSESAASDADATEKVDEPLPTACGAEGSVKDAKACLPPATFAKKLCGGSYPEVALSLFAKGTPWTRVWLAGDVDAWNASGGGLTHRAKLAFDEEVIVLSRHGAASMGGIVMTGAQASFEVVRSDGTCVSVMEGEITTKRPPAPKPASVPWTRLEEGTRKALLASPKVKTSLDALAKACANATTDRKVCEKADRAFSASVLDTVRAGAALPLPSRRP